MTQNTNDPQTIFDRACAEFNEFYDSNLNRLKSGCDSMATLLEMLLIDHPEFSTPTVLGRVKEREECVSKFGRKYRQEAEAHGTYAIRDWITDLVGLRVVCLYDDEVDRVSKFLGGEFEVIGITDKSKSIEQHDDVFGYKGLHLDVKLRAPRDTLREYKRLSDLRFEVQIRSTIQDSWSKLDHHIKYKKDLPLPLKRRIHRLSALFELADQEFRFVRDEKGTVRSDPLAPGAPDVAEIAAESSKPYADSSMSEVMTKIGRTIYGKYDFDPNRVEAFIQEIMLIKPDALPDWLAKTASQHLDTVQRYKEYLRTEQMLRMNPFTFVRHLLYVENSKVFAPLLFPRQIQSFQEWLNRASTGTLR